MDDLIGKTFNQLTVIKKSNPIFLKSGRKRLTWLCKCTCGNTTIVTGSNLKNGTKSCGCLTGGNYVHGKTNTRLYSILNGIKARCNNIKSKQYKYYGGRGITVCDEWLNNPVNFITWAEKFGYEDNLTIERIDVTKGYHPSNCCWIPLSEQAVNRNKFSSNTSGYIGVNWHKASKKWTSTVRNKGISKYLGIFNTSVEAATARNKFITDNNLLNKLNLL